jgi:hypothetical protein
MPRLVHRPGARVIPCAYQGSSVWSLARRGPSNDAHCVTRCGIRISDASYGQANRTVEAQHRGDCYLHGCPCGYSGDPRRACSCAPGAIRRYQKRESTRNQEGTAQTATIVKFERAEATGIGSASSITPSGQCRIPFPDLRAEPTSSLRWPSRRAVSSPPRYRARPCKLTCEQEAAIRTLAAIKSLRSLAVEFGVSHETIRAVCCR